jgi:hypothetical protein
MQRTMLAAGLFLAALFSSSRSQAQNFYDSGEVSVAIERGLGIHFVHQSFDGPGDFDGERDGTAFGIGWYDPVSIYHRPRAAVDVFVTDQLSIGGSLAFYTLTGDPDGDGFLFSPRVGYAIPLSDLFTFWPRGGITFVSINDDSLFGISGEAAFVLTPQPSWGIILAPTLDFGFIGDDDGADYTEFALGIPAVGILGNF